MYICVDKYVFHLLHNFFIHVGRLSFLKNVILKIFFASIKHLVAGQFLKCRLTIYKSVQICEEIQSESIFFNFKSFLVPLELDGPLESL